MLNEAKNSLISLLNLQKPPLAALVLGSGLSPIADFLKAQPDARSVAFSAIKHFPSSSVAGHKGELISVSIGKTRLLVMSGRIHAYEGYSAHQVTLPIRVMGLLGIKTLILTNASGAIASHFEPAELMLISDHLNLTGLSPLLGPNLDEQGPRFVDMSAAYDYELRSLTKTIAQELNIRLHEGVYAGLLGPTYETPAEIRMLKALGADAVGMSTVFETIVARHMGIKVLAISCLTNKAAGLSTQIITHEEVIENNAKVATKLSQLLLRIITALA